MAPTVHSPNPLFTGKVGTVTFVDGKAEVSEDDVATLRYVTEAGYTIDGDAKVDDESGVVVKPLDQLTKPQLVKLAQQRGVTVPGSANKAELVALLASTDAADPGAQKPGIATPVEPVGAGTGPETGAADGAAFGVTPAASDADGNDEQGNAV